MSRPGLPSARLASFLLCWADAWYKSLGKRSFPNDLYQASAQGFPLGDARESAKRSNVHFVVKEWWAGDSYTILHMKRAHRANGDQHAIVRLTKWLEEDVNKLPILHFGCEEVQETAIMNKLQANGQQKLGGCGLWPGRK